MATKTYGTNSSSSKLAAEVVSLEGTVPCTYLGTTHGTTERIAHGTYSEGKLMVAVIEAAEEGDATVCVVEVGNTWMVSSEALAGGMSAYARYVGDGS